MTKHTYRLPILILITTAVFAVAIACLLFKIHVVYQSLLLIPIIFICFWYHRKGIIFSEIILAIYSAISVLLTHEMLAEDIARLVEYTVIAVLIGFMAEYLGRKNKEVSKLNKKITNQLEIMKISEKLSGMGTWRMDLKTNKTFWSDGMYRIFGIVPGSVEPSLESRIKLVHPDDREMVYATIMDSIKNQKSIQIESRIIGSDGNIRWISSIGYTEYDEFGKPETYIGSFLDVTGRKRFEQALFNESEKFRVTISSIGDGLIATDINGKVTLMNKQAEDLTGWELSEADGKDFDEVFNIISETTRKKVESPICRVIKSGMILGLANHTALISKNGIEYSIADSASPIKDDKGNIQGVVLVFRDVTAEKKREQQIQYISYHDSLTGLYNRRYFEEQLINIDTKESLPISVIMGDVNGLKITNDAFGHAQGDCLLQKTAEVIRTCSGKNSIAARWGGDEFVVLLPRTDKIEVEKIVDNIVKVQSKMKVGPINVSVSLGYGIKDEEGQNLLDTLKKAENYMYANKISESEGIRGQFIESIMNMLNEKNPFEVGHYKRVGELSYKIGKALNLPNEELSKLKAVGRLHDIGKVSIGEAILTKTTPLTQAEWREIKKHPDIGYKILKSSKETVGLAEYVLYHHERYDGKGYPSGLRGNDIPLLSRIVSVADSFDAMTHDRSYHKAIDKKDALAELEKNKGTQFDPMVIDAISSVLVMKKV